MRIKVCRVHETVFEKHHKHLKHDKKKYKKPFKSKINADRNLVTVMKN